MNRRHENLGICRRSERLGKFDCCFVINDKILYFFTPVFYSPKPNYKVNTSKRKKPEKQMQANRRRKKKGEYFTV